MRDLRKKVAIVGPFYKPWTHSITVIVIASSQVRPGARHFGSPTPQDCEASFKAIATHAL